MGFGYLVLYLSICMLVAWFVGYAMGRWASRWQTKATQQQGKPTSTGVFYKTPAGKRLHVKANCITLNASKVIEKIEVCKVCNL